MKKRGQFRGGYIRWIIHIQGLSFREWGYIFFNLETLTPTYIEKQQNKTELIHYSHDYQKLAELQVWCISWCSWNTLADYCCRAFLIHWTVLSQLVVLMTKSTVQTFHSFKPIKLNCLDWWRIDLRCPSFKNTDMSQRSMGIAVVSCGRRVNSVSKKTHFRQ